MEKSGGTWYWELPTKPVSHLLTSHHDIGSHRITDSVSRIDRDRCAVPHHRIDLAHFAVGHCDAAPRPITTTLPILPWPPMNENVPTGRFSHCTGNFDIAGTWIVDSDRQIKRAVRIAAINQVFTFGCSPITLNLLVPFGRETKTYFIGLQNGVVVKQIHLAIRFLHNDPRYFGTRICRKLPTGRQTQKKRQKTQ